jgi:hypothetical protein
MGGAVSNFFSAVGKGIAKGAISTVGNMIPYVGPHIAEYVNSKFSKGGSVMEVGGVPSDIPDGFKAKAVNTPGQLKALIAKYPDQAQAAGLTVAKVNEEVAAAKQQMKAIGGMLGNANSRMAGGSMPSYVRGSLPPNNKLQPTNVKMSVGGDVAKVAKVIKEKSMMAVGGKPKKARTQAQMDATAKLVAMNRKRKEKK